MKSVLISIRPEWCELIANGKKTIEVRKTKPKIETPFKCYIYCTKPSRKHQTICGCMVLNDDELYLHPTQGIKHGDSIELMCRDDYTEDNFLNGKIIGEFVCDSIDKFTAEFTDDDCYNDIRFHYLDCYGNEQGIIVTTNESSPDNCFLCHEACLSFDELKLYVGANFHDIPFYGWHISNCVIYDKPKELSGFYVHCKGSGTADDKMCINCPNLHFDCDGLNGYTRWCGVHKMKPLTRPPLSWCYVQEVTNGD